MGMTEYVLLSVMFAIIIIVVVLPVYIFTRPLLKELKELNGKRGIGNGKRYVCQKKIKK